MKHTFLVINTNPPMSFFIKERKTNPPVSPFIKGGDTNPPMPPFIKGGLRGILKISILIVYCIVFLYSFALSSQIENEILLELKNTKKNSLKIDLYRKLAQIYISEDEKKQAVDIYKEALNCSPDKKQSYKILLDIGDLYLEINHYSNAIESYQEAIDIYPRKEKAHLKIAIAYEKSELYELAHQEYESILKHDNKSFDANYKLGYLYFRRGLNNHAMEYYRRALTIKPNKDVYMKISQCAESMGDINLAIAMLNHILSLEKNYEAYLNLGRLYQMQKKKNEAEESFSEAVNLDPHKVQSYIYLGLLYLEDKDLIRAEKLLEIAQEKAYDEGLIHFFLSNIYYKQKKFNKAKEEINKAMGLSRTKMLSIYSEKYKKFLDKELSSEPVR